MSPSPASPMAPWVIALVLLSNTGGAAAATLGEAVTAAYERHPERALVDARQGLAAALENRADQPFAADPAFNLRYDTDAVGAGDGFREWEGGINLPLWWPGQRAAQTQEADRTRDTAAALAAAQRLEVAGEVRQRLWAVALARGTHAEAGRALDSARGLERDVTRRVAAGELARQDLLLARQETAAREDALEQAANRLEQAEGRFQRYTGMDEIPAAHAEMVSQDRELADSHPRLVLAATALERTRAQRRRVAAERRAPADLWLGGVNSRDARGQGFDSSIAVEITVPFGMGAHNAPALAAAESEVTRAAAEARSLRRSLRGTAEAAALELERTRVALDRARQRQDLAAEFLDLRRRAFELGETDLVRLLQARADAVTAHGQLETRRLEAGQAAARLNQALGVIPR
ncbi:MAG: TolC family protein [Gammaproteobacteria bacterium]|nr:TolC family protein [Gammaproteobacteria bacterium]